jgi:ABC-type proline/glycine betaine transport system ATPase subunit
MDRIMVLSDGKLVEFDTPRNLLSNPEGVFTKMVEATVMIADRRCQLATNHQNFFVVIGAVAKIS